jgi:signal transduction histidine kinase
MSWFRRRLGSVRIRTALAAAVTVGIILGLSSVALVRHLRHNIVQNAEATASVRAHDAATLLNDGHLPGRWSLPDDDTAFVQVLHNGTVVAATSNVGLARPVLPTVALGSHTEQRLAVDPDAPFRVVELERTAHGRHYVIVAGSSLDDSSDAVAATQTSLSVAVPIVVLLVGLLTWLAAGRALRPVETLRADVELITASGLNRRVELPVGNDEISRLATTMNAMLEKLDQSVRSQRNFVADASHELRNPLAALRAELEIALAQPGRTPWDLVVRNALGDTRRIQSLARDLLLLAELDAEPTGPTGPTATVDLSELAREVASDYQSGQQNHLTVTGADGVVVEGHPAQLRRLIENLLDNADRHAHGQISVDVSSSDHSARVTVADDGAGIEAADVERIFDRFVRLDDARSRDSGGTGLGLAIAREIAELHGGTIVALAKSSGATFIVTIPLVVGGKARSVAGDRRTSLRGREEVVT